MEISDFIGFIASVLVLLLFIGRHILSARRRQQHPEEAALEKKEQKAALKNFLKSLEVDMEGLDEEEEEEKVMPRIALKKATPPSPPPQITQQPEKPKPHRRVGDDFRFQTHVEQRHFETAVEKRRLETAVEKRKRDFGANIISPDLRHAPDAYSRALIETKEPSRALELVARLGSRKNMVILQEILNPPKAFGPAGYRDRY